jgi:hypothetical protein
VKRVVFAKLYDKGDSLDDILAFYSDVKARIKIEHVPLPPDPIVADAAIGKIVWRFIDRMNDVTPGDDTDRILREFVTAVEPAISVALPR